MAQVFQGRNIFPQSDPSAGVVRFDLVANNAIQAFRGAQQFALQREELQLKKQQATLQIANAQMRNEILQLDHDLKMAQNSPEMLQTQLDLKTAQAETAQMVLERQKHTMKSAGLIENIMADLDLSQESGDVAGYNSKVNAFMSSPDYKGLTLDAQNRFKSKLNQDKQATFKNTSGETISWGDARITNPSSPLVRTTSLEGQQYIKRQKLLASGLSETDIDARLSAEQSAFGRATKNLLLGETQAVLEQRQRDVAAGRVPGSLSESIAQETVPGIVDQTLDRGVLDRLSTKIGLSTDVGFGVVMDRTIDTALEKLAAIDVGPEPAAIAKKGMLQRRLAKAKSLSRDIVALPLQRRELATEAFLGLGAPGALRNITRIPAAIRVGLADDDLVDQMASLEADYNLLVQTPDSEEKIASVRALTERMVDFVSGFVADESASTLAADITRLQIRQGGQQRSRPVFRDSSGNLVVGE